MKSEESKSILNGYTVFGTFVTAIAMLVLPSGPEWLSVANILTGGMLIGVGISRGIR